MSGDEHRGQAGPPPRLALLRGLQFAAIAWVVVNHFRSHPIAGLGAASGVVAHGYVGAALFFMIGGFLLFEERDRGLGGGGFSYRRLLWSRFSLLWPLHLLVLAGFAAVLLAGGPADGVKHQDAFPLADLPAHLLMVQAWGATSADTWNFPSWLVSAQWFAAVAFPATAWIVLRALRPLALALAAPVLLFAVLFLFVRIDGRLFSDLTCWGALQTIPAALMGGALWRLHRRVSPPAPALLALAAAGWIVAAAALGLSDLAIWLGFPPLVWAVAGLESAPVPPRLRAWLAGLGDTCVAVQLVYLPVDMVYFRAARALGVPAGGAETWLLLAGVFPLILLTAAAAWLGLQRPLWRWSLARTPWPARPGRSLQPARAG